jgi:MYXO-CTERM domain-containing protein
MTPRSLVICIALAVGPAAHAANLLVNGSFEQGAFINQGNQTMSLAGGSTAITGWTVLNDVTAWIDAGNPFGLSASDGSRFLDLTDYSAGAPFAGVSQTFATLAGATYTLSFDLGGSNFWGRPDALIASAAGTSQVFATGPASTTSPNNDWYSESMSFVATGASTTLMLQGSQGFNYIGLDNVSVELTSAPPVPAIPEASTWALMLAGLAACGARARRRTGIPPGVNS